MVYKGFAIYVHDGKWIADDLTGFHNGFAADTWEMLREEIDGYFLNDFDGSVSLFKKIHNMD